MTKIERFEEIESWQKARNLVAAIYKITENKHFSKDWSLKDQMRRAAVSIMSNIAEGFSRQTDQEFIQFLYIAKGSVAELQSQLYIASDLSYMDIDTFKDFYDQAESIANLIGGLIRYLKKENS